MIQSNSSSTEIRLQSFFPANQLHSKDKQKDGEVRTIEIQTATSYHLMHCYSCTELLIIILKGIASKLFMHYGVAKQHMNPGSLLT